MFKYLFPTNVANLFGLQFCEPTTSHERETAKDPHIVSLSYSFFAFCCHLVVNHLRQHCQSWYVISDGTGYFFVDSTSTAEETGETYRGTACWLGRRRRWQAMHRSTSSDRAQWAEGRGRAFLTSAVRTVRRIYLCPSLMH